MIAFNKLISTFILGLLSRGSKFFQLKICGELPSAIDNHFCCVGTDTEVSKRWTGSQAQAPFHPAQGDCKDRAHTTCHSNGNAFDSRYIAVVDNTKLLVVNVR